MKYLLLFFAFLSVAPVLAQQDSTQKKTVESPLVKKIKKIAADDIFKSKEEFKNEKIVNKQRIVLASVRNLNQQAKLLLKKAVDTNNLNNFLRDTKKSLEIVKDGIWLNAGSSQTQRNLTVSAAILVELS